jgi:hypothetical protein
MNNVPSENILKLIQLTDKLCLHDEDREIIVKMKKIIESGKIDVHKARTIKGKIKCYETMCGAITNVLNNIQII